MKTQKTMDNDTRELGPMHGQGLLTRVTARRAELEQSLAQLQNSAQQGTTVPENIESELAVLDAMMPGDPTQITPVVAAQLSQWLEANKYLGAVEVKEIS